MQGKKISDHRHFLLYALHLIFIEARSKLKKLLYICFTSFTLLYGALHCFTYDALHCFTLFFISILALKKYIYVKQKNVLPIPLFLKISF